MTHEQKWGAWLCHWLNKLGSWPLHWRARREGAIRRDRIQRRYKKTRNQ